MSGWRDKNDQAEIFRLIKDHFKAMKWSGKERADWNRFRADFLGGARLFPAARPVANRSLDEFVDRMKHVESAVLETFEEHTLGMKILSFGNVAVVMAASHLLENGTEEGHDISAYLLVKSEGKWSIAAHAWDNASGDAPPPAELL